MGELDRRAKQLPEEFVDVVAHVVRLALVRRCQNIVEEQVHRRTKQQLIIAAEEQMSGVSRGFDQSTDGLYTNRKIQRSSNTDAVAVLTIPCRRGAHQRFVQPNRVQFEQLVEFGGGDILQLLFVAVRTARVVAETRADSQGRSVLRGRWQVKVVLGQFVIQRRAWIVLHINRSD